MKNLYQYNKDLQHTIKEQQTRIDEATETMKIINGYFIRLQNKVLLTPGEERAWGRVSKFLNP